MKNPCELRLFTYTCSILLQRSQYFQERRTICNRRNAWAARSTCTVHAQINGSQHLKEWHYHTH